MSAPSADQNAASPSQQASGSIVAQIPLLNSQQPTGTIDASTVTSAANAEIQASSSNPTNAAPGAASVVVGLQHLFGRITYTSLNLQQLHAPVAEQVYLRTLGLRGTPAVQFPVLLAADVHPKQLTTSLFARLICSEHVNIMVGPRSGPTNFSLPVELLRWVSLFFKRAFGPQWNVGRPVYLNEDTPEGFALAVAMIFRPDYQIMPILENESSSPGQFLTHLIELASLGQSLLIPMLVHGAALNCRNLNANPGRAILAPKHVVDAITMLEDRSEMRRVIMEWAALDFVVRYWPEGGPTNLETDWEFGRVAQDYPAFASELLLVVHDTYMRRVS